MKHLDDNGNEIDVFTVEELEAQKAAAAEEAKNASLADIQAKEKELADAKEALKKFEDKDLNFTNLRQQKDAAEKRAEEAIAAVDKKLETVKKEILDGVTSDHKNDVLASLSGGDEELKKKIEFHYSRLSDTAATKEEVTKKLTDAYVLATKPEDNNALNTAVVSSGGAGMIKIKSNVNKLSADEVALAKKMAAAGGMVLEDKDFS